MSFLIFFIAISSMVLIHEVGHFLMAKLHGLRVEEFGLGYPPRLIGKKFKETIYSLNLIPMGGFVRIWGMESRVDKDKNRAFYTQSKKVQLLILAAGVVMNFLLAIGVFSVVYGIQGVPQEIGLVEIVQVASDSPAAESELEVGTEVVAIRAEDQKFETNSMQQFTEIIDQHLGQEVILVSSKGEEYKLTPRESPPEGQGALGVIITDKRLVKTALVKRVPLGIWYGLKEGILWGAEIIGSIIGVFATLFQGKLPKQVSGPIGIYSASRQIFKAQGLLSLIHFFAVVSVNLAIVNVIPIPGTDGWHAGILGFETIRGKKLAEETKTRINQIAMIFILLLSALIVVADVKRFLL